MPKDVRLRELGDDGQGVLVVVNAQTRGLIQRAAAKFRQWPTEAHRDELKTLVDSLMDLPVNTASDRYDAQIATSKAAAKVRAAQLKSVQSTGSLKKNKKKAAQEAAARKAQAQEAAAREPEAAESEELSPLQDNDGPTGE